MATALESGLLPATQPDRVIGKPINSKVGSSAAAAQALSSMMASEDWPTATVRAERLFVCADATSADVNTTAAASIAVILRVILFSIPKDRPFEAVGQNTCRRSPHRTCAEWTLSIRVKILSRHYPIFRVLRHLDEFFVRVGRPRSKHSRSAEANLQQIAHRIPPCCCTTIGAGAATTATPAPGVAEIISVACTAALRYAKNMT